MMPGVRFNIRDERHATGLAIGPGKVALLEAIARTGSITSAAKLLGLSYRRAWLMVDETNRCLLEPAVETAAGGQKGGGTILTTEGLELVRRYRAVERQTEKAVRRDLSVLLRSISPRRPVTR